LSYRKIPTAALIGDKAQFSMADAPLADLARYAGEDADFTLRLYRKLRPQVDAAGLTHVLNDIEMPLIPVLARMERHGVYVDAEELDRFSTRLDEMAKQLEAQIYETAGGPFKINSPKVLQELLFTKLKIHEQLGMRSLKKTKTGYSTDESVLSKLTDHPLPRLLLEYRTVTKLKSTYVDALPQLISPKTNRIHTSFHQTGTATGRLSSSDPNLQNIPIRSALGQEIRKAFKPQNPDCVMISADYSQIELRLLAHIAGEEALAKAFREQQDIHNLTAARIFRVPPAEVDQLMRSRAKAINFGIIYGMGPRRLAQETKVSMAEAQEFIGRYFATYPGIARYIETAVKAARDTGYTTTMSGRRRPVPELREASNRLQASAENVAVNSPVQGSAADLIKIAMIRVHAGLAKAGAKARLLLQVHDELVLECPAKEVNTVMAIVKESMEHAVSLSVPLEVEIGQGRNWLEAH
jgi:DNA polymerase-1